MADYTSDRTGASIDLALDNADALRSAGLDSYEEGTWTPILKFGGGNVGQSGTFYGYYTKIGNLVTANCHIALTGKGTSTGDAKIAGLPFTSSPTTGAYSPALLRYNGVSFADVPSAFLPLSATTVNLEETTNSGTVTTLTNTNFIGAANIMMSIVYRTNS